MVSLSVSILSGQTNFPSAIPTFRWHLLFNSSCVPSIRSFIACSIKAIFPSCSSEKESKSKMHFSRLVISSPRFGFPPNEISFPNTLFSSPCGERQQMHLESPFKGVKPCSFRNKAETNASLTQRMSGKIDMDGEEI